ncbi:MAG: hypothetical protein V3V59_06585 [Thermodesulfovibrionales bacterium]
MAPAVEPAIRNHPVRVVKLKTKPAPSGPKSLRAKAVELVPKKAQVVPTKKRKTLTKKRARAERAVEPNPLPCRCTKRS